VDPCACRVLVLAPGLDAYQAKLVHGMTQVFSRHGVSVLVGVHEQLAPGPSRSLPALVRQLSPCGFISLNGVGSATETEPEVLFPDLPRPVVGIGVNSSRGSWVHGDNESGMRALMTHLLDECGVRRPAHVRGIAHQPDAAERERVFREELARRGIPLGAEFVVDGGFDRNMAYHGVRRLLREHPDVDAVVAANDLSAIGALRAVTHAGLRVPDDVVITGFDNEEIGALTWPGLTTVDQDLEGQGRAAARALLAEIAGAAPSGEVVVRSRLVLRGSTRAAGRTLEEQLESAKQMAELSRGHVSAQDAVLGLHRVLHHCWTVDRVVDALTERLEELGVARCLVAVHEDLLREGPRHGDLLPEGLPWGPPDAELLGNGVRGPSGNSRGTSARVIHPADPPRVRVVLDYRDGRSLPSPESLRPEEILHEVLHRGSGGGTLLVQELSAAGREFGFLIFEPAGAPVRSSEVVHESLALALGSILVTAGARTGRVG